MVMIGMMAIVTMMPVAVVRAMGYDALALGLVLALGIFWGFLEMFELVPHVWAWWVLPVWAIGLGLAQLWQKVRGA